MMRFHKSNTAIEEALSRTFARDRSELLWLAFLLTGDRDISIEVLADAMNMEDAANPFFRNWMISWSRKLVIARALAAVEGEMAASVARTMQRRCPRGSLMPAKGWSLDSHAGKADLERALLGIDLFPRCAVLLTVFEKVSTEDAASLLNADREAILNGKAIGLAELTRNLARNEHAPEPGGMAVIEPCPSLL